MQFDNTIDINVIIQLLKDYFKNEKVLFVYDNVTDTNKLAKFLITDFKNIITTQIQNWSTFYEKIELQVWTKNQALQYLVACNFIHGQGELELLAKELGYHPLAIEHATSFIRQIGVTLPKYFEFLNNQRLQVHSEKVNLEQAGIKTSIIASFLLTIQKLQTEDPEAFQLLSIKWKLYSRTICANVLSKRMAIYKDQTTTS